MNVITAALVHHLFCGVPSLLLWRRKKSDLKRKANILVSIKKLYALVFVCGKLAFVRIHPLVQQCLCLGYPTILLNHINWTVTHVLGSLRWTRRERKPGWVIEYSYRIRTAEDDSSSEAHICWSSTTSIFLVVAHIYFPSKWHNLFRPVASDV